VKSYISRPKNVTIQGFDAGKKPLITASFRKSRKIIEGCEKGIGAVKRANIHPEIPDKYLSRPGRGITNPPVLI